MLVAYEVALDLVRALRPVMVELRRHSADVADQIERAANSVVLNLAEGYRRHGRDPRRFFRMAYGSAGEIRGALDLAEAWGWRVESKQVDGLLDRELRLLWGLTRPGPNTTADRMRVTESKRSSARTVNRTGKGE